MISADRPFQPRKVFLTGANGLLGRAVLHTLDRHDIITVCYTRHGLRDHEGLRYAVPITGDLADLEKLEGALEGCDSIIHCAGIVDFDPGKYRQLHFIHCEALKNLVDAAKKHPVKRLVYVSSHWTIGFAMSKDILLSEENLLSPDNKVHNVYQKTKLEGEDLLTTNRSSGIDFVIVNPAQIWGPPVRHTELERFIARANTRLFHVVPSCGINIVQVSDVADGVVRALRSGRPGQRYLLSGHNVTLKHLLTTFLRIRGKKGLIIELPFLPMRFLTAAFYAILKALAPHTLGKFHFLNTIVAFKYYSSAKALEDLGYSASIDLDAIVGEATRRP